MRVVGYNHSVEDTHEGILEPVLAQLLEETRSILSDPEETIDLVGRRFALRCIEIQRYFSQTGGSFRLAIVGNPNRGKTTFAASAADILRLYGVHSNCFDLDVYTQSMRAMTGEISWSQRPKRSDISRSEVLQNIKLYREAGPGLVIGDFPGKPGNPYQSSRLKASDLVLILVCSLEEKDLWTDLSVKAQKISLWLQSKKSWDINPPLHPFISDLDRCLKSGSIEIQIILTRILEVIAEVRGVPLTNPWNFFTEAQRTVLEEVFDFMYAPLFEKRLNPG